MPIRRGPRAARPLVRWNPPSHGETMTLHAVLDDVPDEDLLTRVLDAMVADELSHGSLRLLPALYPRLRELELVHPAIPRVTGFYRQTRGRNLLLAHSAAVVANALSEADIDVMCLKGLPLAFDVYGDCGMRPMADLDLLVPCDTDFETIRRVLVGLPQLPMRSKYTAYTGETFEAGLGFDVDVHRYLDSSSAYPRAHEDIWRNAAEASIGTHELLFPSREALFYHVVTHGLPHSPTPSVRWAADAVLAYRSNPSFDWDEVQDFAGLFRMSSTLATGLEWLASEGFLPRIEIRDFDTDLDRVTQRARLTAFSNSRAQRRCLARSLCPQGW